MRRREAAILSSLLLALCLMAVVCIFLVVGYVPANGFSQHPQHELIFGITAGLAAGIVIGVSIVGLMS